MQQISESGLFLFALASAVVTANAYYIHPIISTIADHFSISEAMIGIVPSLNQIALAIGIFLLLPLGDWFSNRKLVLIFVACQVVTLFVMAVAQSFWLFVTASTVMGFVTIAPYLLPAYVSKRIPVSRLGHSTAILTAGIIFGILVARAGAGVVSEYLHWRAVYVIAAALMAVVSILLFVIMKERSDRTETAGPRSYPKLLLSLVTVTKAHPDILVSGAIQGLGFGTFLAVWMGIGLHLTGAEMGFGTDVVGYLATLTIFNLLATPRLGRWADRIGAHKARAIFASINVIGVSLYFFTGHSLWLLIIPIFITNTVGPTIDVTNRMTFLNQPPEVRTRLMTVYIVFMFVGGGLASWAGTAAYHYGGWTGTSLLAMGTTLTLFALSVFAFLWKRDTG